MLDVKKLENKATNSASEEIHAHGLRVSKFSAMVDRMKTNLAPMAVKPTHPHFSVARDDKVLTKRIADSETKERCRVTAVGMV